MDPEGGTYNTHTHPLIILSGPSADGKTKPPPQGGQEVLSTTMSLQVDTDFPHTPT